MNVMKNYCFLLLLLSLENFNAQKVYTENVSSRADLLVYIENVSSRATGNEGIWYFENVSSRADKSIYFENVASRADLKICFTDVKSRAGWKNASKKSLMY